MLSFRENIAPEINQYLELVWQQEREKEPSKEEGEFLDSEESLSKISKFYEKIRNSLEIREEHLLRQYAIARILRRQILLEERKENLARKLLSELIRGGYLPNKNIPPEKIEEFEKIIKKYLYQIRKISFLEEKRQFDWWLSLAASEIERKLSYQYYQREKILVKIIFRRLVEIIDLKRIKLPENEKKALLYLAILKGIFKYDQIILRERLFVFYFPKWENLEDFSFLERKNLKNISLFIEKQINSPYLVKLLPLVKKYAIFFWLFADSVKEASLLSENKEEFFNIFKDEKRVESLIERNYWKRVKRTKEKIKRLVFRSVVFLVFSKTILALLFEYPYEVYILKQKNYLPLLTNIFFHPFFLILIAFSFNSKIFGPKNILFQKEKELLFSVEKEGLIGKEKISGLRSEKIEGTFDFLWFLSFFVVFSSLTYLLRKLNFNLVSILFFLFFLTLVSYLGWRARNIAKEISPVRERWTFSGTILSFFALPIIKIGELLVRKMPSFNIAVFLMDFVIEVPFKAVIGGLDEWFHFLRKKREEIET